MLGFPDVRQIGIVVQSIDRTVKYYARSFGIGPWFRPEFLKMEHRLNNNKVIGDEIDIAIAFSGKTQLELIEPISGNQSIYWEHLKKHGEGIHHLGFYVSDIERRLDVLAANGINVLQSGIIRSAGKFGGSITDYAYLDTAGTAGVIFELIRTKFLGVNIHMSSFWFELGSITGDVDKIKI
jgi:catechol 2,3-dioxygenase-like lactoylglutathione lyase family enzyme